MEKQQAQQLLANRVKEAESALADARAIANEYGLQFSFNMGEAANVDRDIGGTYYGKGVETDKYNLTDQWDNTSAKYTALGETSGYWEAVRLEEGAWEAWQSSSEEC